MNSVYEAFVFYPAKYKGLGMRLEQFHAVWLNVLSVHLTDCCHAHEIYDWYIFTKTLVDVQNNELE